MNIERKLPAYPLFVKDPYFSIWTGSEILNIQNVMYWYGTEKKIYGVLKIDDVPYEFMGNYGGLNKMTQTGLKVTSFTTDYVFVQDDVTLNVSFVSPLPLDDMNTLSCPVCYMNYSIESKSEHKFEIALIVDEVICYNDDTRVKDRGTVGGVFDLDKFEAAWFGLVKQAPLSTAEDNICADWGYWYLTGEKAYIANEIGVKDFLMNKDKITYTSCEEQHTAFMHKNKFLIAVNTSKTGKIMMGFDDVAAIRYYGKVLYDLYFEDGKTIIDALKETFDKSEEIDKHLAKLDKDLIKKAEKFGPEYINILYASLRQAIGMHKLCKDTEGNVLFMSREANSNSCIATVDVSYPSMPLFLLYDTEYIKGMMRPILKFARMPVWTYDFAPHDGGTYPNCDGQVYGVRCFNLNSRYYGNFSGWAGGQYRTRPMTYLYPSNYDAFEFEKQMPVEECANMIIMAAACYNVDKDSKFLSDNIDLFEKWVVYLEKYGLIPANQLCTDDFAGHLDKNVNLAIKATVGIECYALICRVLGKEVDAKKYSAIAKEFASKIEEFAYKFKWCPLTWDSDDTTFSLKYNLAFDKILKLGLFSKDFYEREMDCYVDKCNRYGVPLDSRKDYSKSDWLMWTASLTDREDKRNVLITALNNYLIESKTRIPFGDWYETITGDYVRFIARTVQGGNFILLLNK